MYEGPNVKCPSLFLHYNQKLNKNDPCKDLDRPRRFHEVQDPEVGGKAVSPSTGRLYHPLPQEIFLALISVRG